MFKSLLLFFLIVTSLVTNAQQPKSRAEERFQTHSQKPSELQGVKPMTPLVPKKTTYDSVMKKATAIITPTGVSTVSYKSLIFLEKAEANQVRTGVGIFLGDELTHFTTGGIVKMASKPIIKKLTVFTMIGAAILAGEEYLLPDMPRYIRWSIAIGIAILGVMFYHFQKKPTKRQEMF